jgi:hypothetical protein
MLFFIYFFFVPSTNSLFKIRMMTMGGCLNMSKTTTSPQHIPSPQTVMPTHVGSISSGRGMRHEGQLGLGTFFCSYLFISTLLMIIYRWIPPKESEAQDCMDRRESRRQQRMMGTGDKLTTTINRTPEQ